jgi:hypothetical protein
MFALPPSAALQLHLLLFRNEQNGGARQRKTTRDTVFG